MQIRTTSVTEFSKEDSKEKILGLFKESFSDPSASENRAEYVAEKIGISINALYTEIEALGLKERIRKMRNRAKKEGLVKRKDVGGTHVKRKV